MSDLPSYDSKTNKFVGAFTGKQSSCAKAMPLMVEFYHPFSCHSLENFKAN